MLDWFVLAIWGGVLFGLVMLYTGGTPPHITSPWHGQLISFIFITLPFILYFALSENSAWQATLGKHIFGIKVISVSEKELRFGRCFLRNLIKFIPWELGHVFAHHAALQGDGLQEWVWVFLILSVLGALWWMAAIFLADETPYNHWTGCRVVHI